MGSTWKNKNNFIIGFILLVILALLIAGSIFNESISFAAHKILKYLPDTIKLTNESETSRNYGLYGSVEFDMGEKYLKVNTAYSKGEMITITLEGNVIIGNDISQSIKIIDDNKSEAKFIEADITKDDDSKMWSARCSYSFKEVTSKFNVKFENNILPVVMTELENLPQVSNFTTIEGNIDIGVITKYIEDKLNVTLLYSAENENQMVLFPLSDIYLKKDSGEKIYNTGNNSSNTVFFDKTLEPNIQLVIPHVFIENHKIETKLNISKADTYPKKISIGSASILIKKAEWSNAEEEIHYKLPDDKKSSKTIKNDTQKVKLFISQNLNGTKNLNLHDISVTASEEFLIKNMVDEMKVVWSDPYLDDKLYPLKRDDYIEKSVSNLKKGLENISLTVSNPIWTTNKEVIIWLEP